jgi:hypothetical protein
VFDFIHWHFFVGVFALAFVLLAVGAIGRWLQRRQEALDAMRRRDWTWWQDHFEAMRQTAMQMLGEDVGLGHAMELVGRTFLKNLQEIDRQKRVNDPARRKAAVGVIVPPPTPPAGCSPPFDMLPFNGLHKEPNGQARKE